ncbi:MAG: ribulokinase [Candidatus Abyssobacteria bacterium SURF_5]|uniref:Ribulokinase n=1 Tax=Abyssobacteria bacterium (strain SURF_5) TaxID=2093360 RepID=A0A3A4NCE5_ABYX5|nr:MAG: ribulokinase [Candidatus Abyssubacteria bacterium SURF_5]
MVLGVDVGTGSVRAGVFTLRGKMLGMGEHPIQIFRPAPNFAEQSSEDIWSGAGKAIRKCLKSAAAGAEQVIGISFDATCSLVALGEGGAPVTVSPTGNHEQNVIVWMDHRAIGQADRINATGHPVLKYVGGKLSPEQEPPKLLWIKENLPRSWAKTAKFLDLADFMTYKATGKDTRSLCTLVCKWTYLGHKGRFGDWDLSFFEKIDLADLFINSRVGEAVRSMGAVAGRLSPQAAKELGLSAGTAVGVGIIDAHAGGLGVLGSAYEAETDESAIERVLALIGGTSSCHMATTSRPVFVKGVWGPYYGAMVPGKWLLEGGQSATGALIDHIIADSAASRQLSERAKGEGKTSYEILNDIIQRLKKSQKKGPELTKDLHVLPYFHGNRSPHADPYARGAIDGLILEASLENLALRYYAAVQAIAYGTRHIIEALGRKGLSIRKIHACGGGTKNPLWLQEHADITGCSIALPSEPEAMLLGTALLAATAAGAFEQVTDAMAVMSRSGKHIDPDPAVKSFHDAKYGIFKKMYLQQLESREIMSEF